MTTGWGQGHWPAPRTAWLLARDTVMGCGPASMKDIPPPRRPDVIIALGAQVRSFAREAALLAPFALPDPARDWEGDVPCGRPRQLAAAALAGTNRTRVPADPCAACTQAALTKMTALLLDAMTAAGYQNLAAVLDWLASRAR